jgi:hypothetical protein
LQGVWCIRLENSLPSSTESKRGERVDDQVQAQKPLIEFEEQSDAYVPAYSTQSIVIEETRTIWPHGIYDAYRC